MAYDATLSAGDLADLLEITARRVHQLVQEGVLVRGARGRYPLRANLHAYLRHQILLSGGATRPGGGETSPVYRKQLAEAKLAERKAEEAEGASVPRDAALALNQQLVSLLGARVLQIPNSWSPEVLGIKNRREAVVRLRPLMARLLEELRGVADELDVVDGR